MFVRKPKEEKKVLGYLERDKRYFLIEYIIIKKLLNKEYKIAQNLHKLARGKSNLRILESIESELNKLERRERWQQIRSRYPKLRVAMQRLSKSPVLSAKAKEKINILMQKFQVFEADLLFETKVKLDPLIRNKKPNEIDWNRVIQITTKLKVDLQALTLLDKELKEAVES